MFNEDFDALDPAETLGRLIYIGKAADNMDRPREHVQHVVRAAPFFNGPPKNVKSALIWDALVSDQNICTIILPTCSTASAFILESSMIELMDPPGNKIAGHKLLLPYEMKRNLVFKALHLALTKLQYHEIDILSDHETESRHCKPSKKHLCLSCDLKF